MNLQAEQFSSFGTTYHDFLICTVENDIPKIIWQPKGSANPVRHAIANNTNKCYVIPEGPKFRLVTLANVSALAIVYFDPSFRMWLDANKCIMMSNPDIVFNGLTFQNIFIARSAKANPLDHAVVYVTADDTKFWSNVGSITSYVSNIQNYDIKFYSFFPQWYTAQVDQQIKSLIVSSAGTSCGVITEEYPIVTRQVTSPALTSVFNMIMPKKNNLDSMKLVISLDCESALFPQSFTLEIVDMTRKKEIVKTIIDLSEADITNKYKTIHLTQLNNKLASHDCVWQFRLAVSSPKIAIAINGLQKLYKSSSDV